MFGHEKLRLLITTAKLTFLVPSSVPSETETISQKRNWSSIMLCGEQMSLIPAEIQGWTPLRLKEAQEGRAMGRTQYLGGMVRETPFLKKLELFHPGAERNISMARQFFRTRIYPSLFFTLVTLIWSLQCAMVHDRARIQAEVNGTKKLFSSFP